MKNRIVRITTIALCAVLLLGATLAKPAQADQPVPWSYSDSYVREIDCGDGRIIYNEVSYELEGLDWFAHDGNWVRWSGMGWFTDRFFTNWNDAVIQTDRVHWNESGDCDNRWDTCVFKGVGNSIKVILPGYGQIYHSVGLIINADWTLLKITPKLEMQVSGDFSPLCDYFAGQ